MPYRWSSRSNLAASLSGDISAAVAGLQPDPVSTVSAAAKGR